MKHARADHADESPRPSCILPYWHRGVAAFGRSLPYRGEDGQATGGDPWMTTPLPRGPHGWKYGGAIPCIMLMEWEDRALVTVRRMASKTGRAAALADHIYCQWSRRCREDGTWKPGRNPPPPVAFTDDERAEIAERFIQAADWLTRNGMPSHDDMARASEAGLLPGLPDPLRQDYMRHRASLRAAVDRMTNQSAAQPSSASAAS